jgi:bacillithiol system protein YtxJ
VAVANLVTVMRPDAWRGLRASPGPVILFKHSTACGQSAAAYRTFQAWAADLGAAAPTLAVVRVREERFVSELIAKETGVRHASPQVLGLKGGRVVGHLDSAGIKRPALDSLLQQVGSA